MWPFQITTYIIWRSYCLSATRLLSLVVRQYLSIPSTLVDLTVLRGFLLPNVCGVLSTIVCLFYYCIVCLFYYWIVCFFYYCIVCLFYYCIVCLFYYCIVCLFYYSIVLSFLIDGYLLPFFVSSSVTQLCYILHTTEQYLTYKWFLDSPSY
jgi:hypothetical protein